MDQFCGRLRALAGRWRKIFVELAVFALVLVGVLGVGGIVWKWRDAKAAAQKALDKGVKKPDEARNILSR